MTLQWEIANTSSTRFDLYRSLSRDVACVLYSNQEKSRHRNLITTASSIGAKEMDNINVISSVQKTCALLHVISCMEGFTITSRATL